MRIPIVAACTLAALSVGDLTHQALANPNTLSGNQNPAASNYVVPTTSANNTNVSAGIEQPAYNNYVVPTQTPTAPAIQPEAPIKPQFAQTPLTSPRTQPRVTTQSDVAVTATDVQIIGATEELQQIVRSAIATRPGGGTNQVQRDKDVAAILGTGLFTNARVTTQPNSAGVKVVYQVQPVIVRSLQLVNAQVLTPAVANNAFKTQLGTTVSPAALRQGVQQIQKWYTDNGYVLAQVVTVRPESNGVVTVEVAEGVVGDVNFRFFDKDGKAIEGRTKPDFLKRELKLKPGQVFRADVARQDLQQLYQLGLFDKADVALNGDARKVEVTYDLTERLARSVNAGGGYNNDSGLFGTVSYRDQNIGGVNQQVGLNVQVGQRDLQFDGKFSDPYRSSNPDRLGYSIDAFRRRSISSTFNEDIKLANGDTVREGQFGGGLSFSRPIDNNVQASVGLNYTRTSIRDRSGKISPVDGEGNQLSFSKTGVDDLVTVSAGLTKDQRNNPLNPTQGSVMNLTTEQSIPVGNGNILMNRIQGNYSQYVPAKILGTDQQEVLAFNVQAGTTIGDLPPYQAFNLGGANSVRGYSNGGVASGRSYVLASAEYRVPLFSPVGGVLFADYASDLGSSDTVPGEPGVVRGKPGSGFGYGAGLRLNSPIGIIRADYGFNTQGEGRLQLGIGQRF